MLWTSPQNNLSSHVEPLSGSENLARRIRGSYWMKKCKIIAQAKSLLDQGREWVEEGRNCSYAGQSFASLMIRSACSAWGVKGSRYLTAYPFDKGPHKPTFTIRSVSTSFLSFTSRKRALCSGSIATFINLEWARLWRKSNVPWKKKNTA